MSSIKLTADSGGGTFEIKAPSSGSNARVLTIPDETATLLTSSTNTGKILQVVSTVTNGAASVSLSNVYANNSSYIYYLTSLTTTLTTTQTNSKILISANIFGEGSVVDNQIGFVLSSSINSGTDTPIDTLRGPAYGDRARVTTMMSLGNHTGDNDSTPSTTTLSNFEYAPSQASGTSIAIKIGVVAISSTGTWYLNRTVFDGNGAAYEKGSSGVTLMEVAA